MEPPRRGPAWCRSLGDAASGIPREGPVARELVSVAPALLHGCVVRTRASSAAAAAAGSKDDG